PEQVLEGRSELLANAPTPTFLNVNHYILKAPKELPVFPNGVKEWNLSFTSATALLKTKSSLLHALFTLLLLHGGTPMSRPLVMKPLTVKGTDLASYTQRFQELALLCERMFSEESDKIEKYVR
nr:hypothetical protein [Tanacetum cinerariifolium]